MKLMCSKMASEAVLTSELVAAAAAADATGMAAWLSVTVVPLNMCGALTTEPLRATLWMPEPGMPLVEMKRRYAPQRTPNFCSSAVMFGGRCGTNVSDSDA